MKLVAQTRRTVSTCNGVELISMITCVGRSLTRVAGQPFTYRPLYTVEVFFGTRVARVRNVPDAEAIAWELELVRRAFIELGALTP